MHVQILIYDGCDELDAVAPFEVLRAAAWLGANLRAELVTADDAAEVTAAHGLRLKPHARLDPAARPDVLIVPGGGWVARAAQGARAEAQKGEIPALIAECHRGGSTVACVCTGAMLAASAGLVRG